MRVLRLRRASTILIATFIVLQGLILLVMAHFLSCGVQLPMMAVEKQMPLVKLVKTKCIEVVDLENIVLSEDNIFFIETNNRLAEFHARVLCAFESAVIHNPLKKVIIVISHESILSTVPQYFEKYENIIFAKVDFNKVVTRTYVEEIWQMGQVTSLGFSLNNMSNILRIVLLLKFGGTYFDSDVISIRQLPIDKQNFLIAQSEDKANNGILRFHKGHPFLKLTLKEMVANFNSGAWGANGPDRVTDTARKYCNFHSKDGLIEGQYCTPVDLNEIGFSVLDHVTGQPISWWWWEKYFEPFESKSLNNDLLKGSFAVHYWNHCRTFRSTDNRCVTGRKETQREYLLDPEHLLYRIFKANCPVTEKHLLRNLIGHPY